MNKKTFIRSIESILAILLFISFYNVATQALTPSLPRANPTLPARELLNALEQTHTLNEYINTYSLRELSIILKYILPPTQGFKIELNYYEPLIIKNTNNYQTTQNLTFIRTLPETTNINSINVFNQEGRALPIQVINNFYKVSISIQTNQELNNQTIELPNIHLKTNPDQSINTTSLRAYINAEKTIVSLESINYNTNYYDANASIKILIPYAEQNTIIPLTILYAGNQSSEINNQSLPNGITLPYTTQEPEPSKTSEIRFQTTLEPEEEQTLRLYYELNTITERTYEELTPNLDGITILTRDEYHASTNPLPSYQSALVYNVRKNIITEDINCLINLKVWNYE